MRRRRLVLLERAAQRGKYAPLYEHLKDLKIEEWPTSFAELERILGFNLPDSAYIYRPWWANQGVRGAHSQAVAWEMAGWRTSRVNMEAGTLVFVRA